MLGIPSNVAPNSLGFSVCDRTRLPCCAWKMDCCGFFFPASLPPLDRSHFPVPVRSPLRPPSLLQICRKGFDLASVGPDFTLDDLQKLEFVTKALAQLGFMSQELLAVLDLAASPAAPGGRYCFRPCPPVRGSFSGGSSGRHSRSVPLDNILGVTDVLSVVRLLAQKPGSEQQSGLGQRSGWRPSLDGHCPFQRNRSSRHGCASSDCRQLRRAWQLDSALGKLSKRAFGPRNLLKTRPDFHERTDFRPCY